MFSDLTTDAVAVNESTESTQHSDTSQVPKTVNISNSRGVHIGPVNNFNSPEDCTPVNRPTRDKVLRMLQEGREVSALDISSVSDHLGNKWRSLGREMGFTSGQLDGIDNDHRRLQDKVDELLNNWRDRESCDATFAQLTRLLMRVQAFDAVINLHP